MNETHMTFSLIDYSDVFYRVIKKSTVPKQRGGKFVQIRNDPDRAEYLVLSPGELSSHHANIVERFCIQHDIEGSYNMRKDYFEVYDPEWTIIGGGKWFMDESKKTLSLFGSSTGYGNFKTKDLKERLLSVDTLSGYIFTINPE